MKQILLILQREFNTRVRKKSFIIITLITPILFAALMVLPAYLMSRDDEKTRNIAVVDLAQRFDNVLESTDNLRFSYIADTPLDQLKATFEKAGYYGLLVIDTIAGSADPQLTMYAHKQPSVTVLSHITRTLEKEVESRKLSTYNIENLDQIMASVKTKLNCSTINISSDGEEKQSSTTVAMALAYILGFIIYMMVMLTGNMVMQGVIEEKHDRVIEVIISSIKPFNLMMGKILGIASVSLVQIAAWIVLTLALSSVAMSFLGFSTDATAMTGIDPAMVQDVSLNANTNEMLQAIYNLDFGLIIGSFVFFFLFGYLLYAALFAAAGSAVENESETQQLVLPITIPMMLGIFVMIAAMKSPDSALVQWCSMIPFTSPIVMLARIPFGVPTWEIVLSGALLLATFVGVTYIAAKIYRVGILMYGKKATFKEIWKWMRYKN